MRKICTKFYLFCTLLMLACFIAGCASEEDILEEMKTTKDMRVFIKDCKKIKNQKVLLDIVISSDNLHKKYVALDHITDIAILEQLTDQNIQGNKNSLVLMLSFTERAQYRN